MTKLDQVKKALEEHFDDVSFSGCVFCAKHVHDGRLNQAFPGLIGDLRQLSGVKVELLIYDPRRQYVVFYGCEKHATEVASVFSRKWTILDWEECPLEPLYCTVDYFVEGRVFDGWGMYLDAISDKLRIL